MAPAGGAPGPVSPDLDRTLGGDDEDEFGGRGRVSWHEGKGEQDQVCDQGEVSKAEGGGESWSWLRCWR